MHYISVSVELATVYLNSSLQLNTDAIRLPDLLTRAAQDPDPAPALQGTVKAWALNRRLSGEVRSAVVTAHLEGVRQQVLADRYEVSLSSVKRLLRAARGA